MTLSRRAFLALTALAAPLVRLRLAAQAAPPAISLDEFVRLSQRLVARTALDREVAATYLNALLAVAGNAAPLARLARSAPAAAMTPAQAALAPTIIEWWYTGIYTLNGEPKLATHTGALMWNALGMPAPGTCAGAFGAWARPPRAAA
jgi:hypothetical protein